MQVIPIAIGETEILDVRHEFPNEPDGFTGRRRVMDALAGVAVHHDGAIMAPGDQDYSGSSLDEDLERLQTIYSVSLSNGWGGFCYHLVGSPNGRVFYTQSVYNYGAQVARRNDELLGIALMGDFTNARPNRAQLCAGGLALVAAWYLAGRLLDTRGHWEWALPSDPTACPGNTWTQWQHQLLVMARVQGRVAWPGS